MGRQPDALIRVRAFITVNGEKADVDTLPPEMQKKLATWLKLTWMNTMFRGKAVFTVTDKTMDQQENQHIEPKKDCS